MPDMTARVPENEIDVEFARSSGPGGQNVNKRSTKARIRWNVGASAAFSAIQKTAIRAAAGGRRNAEDEIIVEADSERSQSQNRDAAVRRLQALVAAALVPKKVRRETKVSRSQKRQRLESKRIVARKKEARRPPKGEW